MSTLFSQQWQDMELQTQNYDVPEILIASGSWNTFQDGTYSMCTVLNINNDSVRFDTVGKSTGGAYYSPENLKEIFSGKNCEITDLGRVSDYVFIHDIKISHLFEALSVVQKYFGNQYLTRLSIFSDSEEDYSTLVLEVLTSLPHDEARKKMDLLEENWYFKLPEAVQVSFQFHLIFI